MPNAKQNTSPSTTALPSNINLTGPQEKLIPKLCTGVFFQVSGPKIIISLTYHEGDNPTQATVIERAALDIQHAKAVSESLKKVIEDIEKEEEKKKEEKK